MDDQKKQQLNQAMAIMDNVIDRAVKHGLFDNQNDVGNAINAKAILHSYVTDAIAIPVKLELEEKKEPAKKLVDML